MTASVREALFTIDVETGHDLVVCEIGTGDLKEITIDSTCIFPIGDNQFEISEIEYLQSTYSGAEPLSYDDFDWSYDNKQWLEYVSQGVIAYLLNEQPEDFIKAIEFNEVTSPKDYTFVTDHMYAKYTVDETLLRAWWDKTDFTFEAEMAEGGRHGSHSGFWSFIEGRHKKDPVSIETMMMLDRWIESWSDWDKFTSFVREFNTGAGEEADCISYEPDTNAGLLAWVEAGFIVEDHVVNDFAARRVELSTVRVGDRIAFAGIPRVVTDIHISTASGVSRLSVTAPYLDGSGNFSEYLDGDRMVWRSFNPDLDGHNK